MARRWRSSLDSRCWAWRFFICGYCAVMTSSFYPTINRQRQTARFKKIGARLVLYAAVIVLVVETLAPLVWMFISSISDGKELLSLPPHWLPEAPTLERYTAILFSERVTLLGSTTSSPAGAILGGLVNSLLIAGSATVLCLVFGLLAAYSLARLRLRGKDFFLLGIMSVQMVPAISTVIPLLIIFRLVDLVDTRTSLVITYSGFTIAYIVWVMTGYIKSLPVELEEAAL